MLLTLQEIVGLLCLYTYNVSTGYNGRAQMHNDDDDIIYHYVLIIFNIIFYIGLVFSFFLVFLFSQSIKLLKKQE